MIPVAVIRPIAEAWVAEHDNAEAAYQRLELASGLSAVTWRRRFSDTIYIEGSGVAWWAREALDPRAVDEFLTAAGLPHVWYTELAAYLPALPPREAAA